MNVKINKVKYNIKYVSEVASEKDGTVYLGLCSFITKEISIRKDSKGKKKTIIHELTHAFMQEYGHNGYDNFDKERVADIVEAFAEEIVIMANKIIDKLGD